MRVLFDPAPRTADEIFSAADRATFFDTYDVVAVDPAARDRVYPEELPKADVLISQQPMELDALTRAAPG